MSRDYGKRTPVGGRGGGKPGGGRRSDRPAGGKPGGKPGPRPAERGEWRPAERPARPETRPAERKPERSAPPRRGELDEAEGHDSTDVLSGIHPVLALLETAPERISRMTFLEHGRGLEPLVALAKQHRIPFDFHPRERLERLAGTHRHQGVAARIAPLSYATLDEIMARAKANPPGLVVALDEVEDPHNLGAVVRSAEAAGAHGVILPKRRSASLTAAAARASAGALMYLPVARVDNLAQALQTLKDNGFWVYGLDAAGEDLYGADVDLPIALVAGSEESGMRPLVARQCDRLLAIPLVGHTPSLNVSVATAVALFSIQARRAGKPSPAGG